MFVIQSRIPDIAKCSCNPEIDLALTQLAMERIRVSDDQFHDDTRLSARDAIDDGWHIVRGQRRAASDPNFSRIGIGQGFDLPHPATEIVERSRAAIEQCTAVFRRRDALAMTIE